MKLTDEKGVTLIALVTTIVILLILVSIGTNSGMSAIEMAKFNKFKSEIKIIQSKVNELYNAEQYIDIGENLNLENEKILNKKEVTDIIYENKTEEEKEKIKNGFKYFSIKYIEDELGIQGIENDYLINIEKRFIISCKPIKYNEINYYMIEQTNESLYNVEYNNKNSTNEGNFNVTTIEEDDRWKIEITNIEYDGYIDDWQVKYKEESESYWSTSNDLTFYVKNEGKYNIKVVHGNEVNLKTQNIIISKNYSLKYNSNANEDYVRNMPEDLLRIENQETKISEKIPERDGYEFVGWGVTDEDTTSTYQPGDSFEENKEETINLYAIWKKI